MTATQRFIKDAIKGGWRKNDFDGRSDRQQNYIDGVEGRIEQILLDPKTFQAVGKVRGWEEPKECLIDGVESHCSDTYQNKARNFFQYVLDGKNVEEALQAIE